MSIEAELHVGGIGGDQHVVKIADSETKLGVMIVVGKGDAFGAERSAELIEGSTLGADLCFGFVFWSTPADRLRICHKHTGAKRLQRVGCDGDDMVDAGSGGTRVVQLAVHVGRFHGQSGLSE